jgi:hypothetical protein
MTREAGLFGSFDIYLRGEIRPMQVLFIIPFLGSLRMGMSLFRTGRRAALLLVIVLMACGMERSGWKPADNSLMTRWGKRVDPERVLPEYPRPQLVRKEWLNLNGLWQFEIPQAGGSPAFGRDLADTILVPFPVESALSGVKRHTDRIRYRRLFHVPPAWEDRRLLLHFGAVDWEASIYLNGKSIGTHRGGYDAFEVDATGSLNPAGENELIVDVFDPTDAGNQPRGKQVLKPEGIYYTPSTGIWQTVWLEPVPEKHIVSYALRPDVDSSCVRLKVDGSESAGGLQVQVAILENRRRISEIPVPVGAEFRIPLSAPRLWSPGDPFLYGLELTLLDNGNPVDQITGYFGMRKISVQKDDKGVSRLFLNGNALFQLGPLDQGFWPDGLYTAPSDEALKYDIEAAKRLGFNMIRKHVKVEPARWYFWCDKLGMLVWQDMPSADNGFAKSKDPDGVKRQFELELRRMIETHFNAPSIVMWVVFNEGWGQYDTGRLTSLVKSLDPGRLADNASGWTDMGAGDVTDMHLYPGPGSPAPGKNRAAVLGEFGGLGFAVPNHTWQKEHWGYRNMKDLGEYALNYEKLYDRLWELKSDPGLSAAVYTQTSDVETEVNGLMTYDREVLKIDPARALGIHSDRIVSSPRILPDGGLFLDSLSVSVENRKALAMRYTLDGSEPTRNSTLYLDPILLRESGTVKAGSFDASGNASGTVAASFRKTDYRKNPPQPSGLVSGLRFAYYEGAWEALPDFAGLKPSFSGTVSNFKIDRRKRELDFGFAFDGWIRIPADGLYSFFVSSDDGVRLSVNGEEVVLDDGIHGIQEKKGQIALRAGRVPIALRYFQHLGGLGLDLRWAGPGFGKSAVPDASLFREK